MRRFIYYAFRRCSKTFHLNHNETDMSMTSLLNALLESQQMNLQQPKTQDPLGELLGGLIGQSRVGAQMQTHIGLVLGALEGLLGFQPNSGVNPVENMVSGMATGEAAIKERLMPLLQPTVNRLAEKANIEPQAATAIVSLVLHYMLSSHPASGRNSMIELNNLMAELKTGSVNIDALNNSGIIEDLMQATGMDRDSAIKSLDSVFGMLSNHMRGA